MNTSNWALACEALGAASRLTKASREVNLTQSAVSLHIKRLEDQSAGG